MAQKRMIDKKISVSEQVANLSREAQLIFTWAMAHSDDIGLLPYSTRTLKATIVPMWDIAIEEFAKIIKEIQKQDLWQVFEYKEQRFFRIPNFTRYQTLKKDRQPQTGLPIEFSKDPKDSWKTLETIGFQTEDNVFQMDTEEKRREEKRREEKNTASAAYLSKIPPIDIKEFTDRFVVTEKQIKSKAEDLLNYCSSKGKKYKNYKSFLLNALKNDFKEKVDQTSGKYAKL